MTAADLAEVIAPGNRQTPIIREKARKKHGEESPDRD
jgi:hypothetical protein